MLLKKKEKKIGAPLKHYYEYVFGMATWDYLH